MRDELQFVLDSVRGLSPEQLPELLGELEVIRATAMLRLSAPVSVPQRDELLEIGSASERLGVSTDYLYRHAKTLPFTKRMGRMLRFSSSGIDEYLRKRR